GRPRERGPLHQGRLRDDGQRVHPRHQLHRHPDHPGRPRRLPRRGGPVPAGRGQGLPLGEPDDDRAPAAGAGGRHLPRPVRPDARQAELDLRPRRGRPRPGAGLRAAAGGLLRPLPGLRARHHGARRRRRADGTGGHEQLPADHPRLLHRVDRAPPRRRPGALPRTAPRRDRRGGAAGVHRGEQRCLPLRLRRLAGGLRQGLRPAVHRAGLAGGAAVRAALPRGGHHHGGRRPALHDAGPLRPRLPRPLQVQPAEAQRVPGALGLRARPVPDAGLRRHDRLRADQAALLRRARRHQPDADRAEGPRPVGLADRERPRGARWT
ncbi:MAG: FIG00820534: hypothetical protein, partial [uncultured Friedmanniella sp.]